MKENASEKLFYTVYKITNKLNGKYYIGAHQTINPYDDYFGSGLYIKRAIDSCGLSNFNKEILHFCNTKEEMFQCEHDEIELSGGYYPKNEMSYNLKESGHGGWIIPEVSPIKGKHFGVEFCNKVKELTINAMWKPDVRQRYLEANSKVDRTGKNNVMYGDTRIFVTNLELRIRKRIDEYEVEHYL